MPGTAGITIGTLGRRQEVLCTECIHGSRSPQVRGAPPRVSVHMTGYLRDSHGVRCDRFIEVFGPPSASCRLMIVFSDLGALESWWNGLAADPEFGRLHAVEHSISAAGTTQQALLHSHIAR